jgi:hypothetical protein
MWANVESDTTRPAEFRGKAGLRAFISSLVAEALLAHVLQRGVQALIILVT